MTPDPRPGIERHKAIRFSLGLCDHFPRVDPHLIAKQHDLIDQPDSHKTESVLLKNVLSASYALSSDMLLGHSHQGSGIKRLGKKIIRAAAPGPCLKILTGG